MLTTHNLIKGFFALSVCFQTACITNNTPKSNSLGESPSQNTYKNTADSQSAQNVILFIGDGMGVSTVTAGRIFDGQSQGLDGEAHSLAFEAFDNVALIKTYNVDSQVPDSAGTATAIMSGYKARIGVINVTPDKTIESCDRSTLPPTLSKRAKAAGKSVGIISTARLTHATPAAMYAHALLRGWETNSDVRPEFATAGCLGIAEQLVEADSGVDLALGGGRRNFTQDEADLTTQWSELSDRHIYVNSADQFRALKTTQPDNVLGLFDNSHMDFEADRTEAEQPSLAEMTRYAIQNLSARDTGYVLMVEAGRIDHAHHGSNAYRALKDLQALNEAVKVAVSETGDDTLIMVTADHSHVFTMAGYPVRGNPILGLVRPVDSETGKPAADYTLAKDGKPYTTLGYHNGPNVRTADSPALTDDEVQAKNFQQQTSVPTGSETHGGEDVPLYATGPGADRVKGVMDQNEISAVMTDAMKIK